MAGPRSLQPVTITAIQVSDRRRVSLDIGPFEDQDDLLQFAMRLESMPGVLDLELLDGGTETALFVLRTRSAPEFVRLLKRVPGYRISATSVGNMVSARFTERSQFAAFLLWPLLAVDYARRHLPSWQGAGVVGGAAAAAGVLYVALTGGFPAATTPASATPTAVSFATRAATTPPSTPTPTPTPTPTAPPADAPLLPAFVTPPVIPTPVPTPTPTPTPVPVVTSRYGGIIAGSFGTVHAVNGCGWDTSFAGTVALSLTSTAGGPASGSATFEGRLDYRVTDTPSGATCNAASAQISASGSANEAGSGPGSVTASLSGDRALHLAFTGAAQGNTLIGTFALERELGSVSTAGDKTEIRTTSVAGVTLSRTN